MKSIPILPNCLTGIYSSLYIMQKQRLRFRTNFSCCSDREDIHKLIPDEVIITVLKKLKNWKTKIACEHQYQRKWQGIAENQTAQ